METPDIEIGLGLDLDNKPHSIIKVIGVGGGGNNAINHMFKQNIGNVSFVVCNTDAQALHNSPVPTRVLIGPTITKGLGAGNDPQKAKLAAEESAKEIAALFEDETKMVFITAGMGGGTGTGAAPVVAKIAREKGVLTIGIVTIPFLFEGEKKIIKALEGADEMSKYVDALLLINNERLTEIYPGNIFLDAFGKADDTLTTAARSISELITTNGIINLDFNDVNTTLRDGGVAIISSGYGEGEGRVTSAIKDALNSPLLKNRDVYGSKKVLFNLYFSRNAKEPFVMAEASELTEFMCNFSPEVDVIWGVGCDDSLGDKVKITILAAGFDVTLRDEAELLSNNSSGTQPATQFRIPPKDAGERLADEYGKEKIAKRQQEMAKARYVILTPDQFDDEEIIEIIDKTPTFNRDAKFKETIKNTQLGLKAEAEEQANNNMNDNNTTIISF
ncbi:MAG: cell division protein FtsZ [Bacteroidales bacterium]